MRLSTVSDALDHGAVDVDIDDTHAAAPSKGVRYPPLTPEAGSMRAVRWSTRLAKLARNLLLGMRARPTLSPSVIDTEDAHAPPSRPVGPMGSLMKSFAASD